MSAHTDDSGPAFPHIDSACGRFEPGMDLLDYFAAKALPEVFTLYWGNVQSGTHGCDEGWREGIAHDAYAMADAMLRARAAIQKATAEPR